MKAIHPYVRLTVNIAMNKENNHFMASQQSAGMIGTNGRWRCVRKEEQELQSNILILQIIEEQAHGSVINYRMILTAQEYNLSSINAISLFYLKKFPRNCIQVFQTFFSCR